jgi:hypothetical protein
VRAPVGALALLLSACSSLTPEERGVRDAFEAWRAGSAAGNVDVNFSMLSLANRSDWLLRRLEEDDPAIRDRRAQLTGAARTDLDLWLEHHKKFRPSRAEPLPRSLREHPWVRQVYEDTLSSQIKAVRSFFGRITATGFAVEGDGATVTARLSQETLFFSMVVEDGAWKVDGQIIPR